MNPTNDPNLSPLMPPQNTGPQGLPPENTAYPHIPFPEATKTKKSRRGRVIIVIFVLLIILGLGAYGVFAYTQKQWPFQPSIPSETVNTPEKNTNSTSQGEITTTNESTGIQGVVTKIFNIVINKDQPTNKSDANQDANQATNTEAKNTNQITNTTSPNSENSEQNNVPEKNTNQSAVVTETNATAINATTNETHSQPQETETTSIQEPPVANDGTLSNEEIDQISASYKNSQKVSSLGFGFNMTMDAKGLSRASLKLDGTGKIEQEEFLYPDSEIDLSYNLNANGVTAQGGGEAKTVDGVAYLKIDGIQTNVTAINNFISTAKGITGTSISGKWLKIVYEEIAEYYEDESMPDLSQAKEALNEYWILYTALGTLEEAEYIGKETINGVTTDHYRTIINQEEMQKALDQASSLVYNPQMIALMEIFEYILAHTQNIPVDIWIGNDNLIYQLETTIQYYDPNIGNDITFSIKANASDYNEPVTITPPESAILASQSIAKLYELMFALLGTYTGDVPKLQGIIQIFL